MIIRIILYQYPFESFVFNYEFLFNVPLFYPKEATNNSPVNNKFFTTHVFNTILTAQLIGENTDPPSTMKENKTAIILVIR